MKVIIPVLGFGKSGGNRVLSKLADELISLGHEVFFLCPDNSDDPYFPSVAKVIWIDKNGKHSFTKSSTSHSSNFLFSFYRFVKALKNFPKESIDVILANQSLTTLPIKVAGLANKTIYYVQAYEPEYYTMLPGLKNNFFRILSEYSYSLNLFTIVNAEIYLNYKKINSSRVLYPGIDFNLFYPAEKNQTSGKIIIGTVGRIEKFKGSHYVLEAFIQIKKQYPTAELHVAFGNDKDFKGVAGVYCKTPNGDKALGEYYRSLDYYFCAGNIQMGAFHYPVAEALSCGIPLITTSYYPANEINAWMVKPHSSEELISAFITAFNNQKETKNKVLQGLKDAEQFEWKKVGKKLDGFLQEFKQLNF